MCALGLGEPATVQFLPTETIPYGGVMFLLPFLLECGLLSYRNHYSQRLKGFYNFDNLFIIIAFLYLCRIKSFEQIKKVNPGEFGRLVGYDRIPEVKTLRSMVEELTSQKRTDKWAADLSRMWIAEEDPQVYYVDGHVQVYHGYLANLGKKHVSRQRLCLPGMMEFWVNSSDGSPYFFVTATVNEKMIEMLNDEIIPELIKLHTVSEEQKQLMSTNPDEPLFTLVFDREGYSPEFFATLWTKYRIAIITYRKNVTDQWDESLFEEYSVPTKFGEEEMKLHEKTFTHEKCVMREVRSLGSNGRQTSIVSTNKILEIVNLASCMFARWSQENFFRYMRQDFALDKIIQYSIDEIDGEFEVVNQEYNNVTYKIKKEREKKNRRKSKIEELQHKNTLLEETKTGEDVNEKDIERKKGEWLKDILKLTEEVQLIDNEIDNLITRRKDIPYKIPVSEMPESTRYNKLNQESKALQNIIKIICYRAETALVDMLSPHYKCARNDIRMLIKSIIQTPIDMEIDNENELLKITLYPLSNQRSNNAVSEICDKINETNTVYPGTNLRLFYSIATS